MTMSTQIDAERSVAKEKAFLENTQSALQELQTKGLPISGPHSVIPEASKMLIPMIWKAADAADKADCHHDGVIQRSTVSEMLHNQIAKAHIKLSPQEVAKMDALLAKLPESFSVNYQGIGKLVGHEVALANTDHNDRLSLAETEKLKALLHALKPEDIISQILTPSPVHQDNLGQLTCSVQKTIASTAKALGF